MTHLIVGVTSKELVVPREGVAYLVLETGELSEETFRGQFRKLYSCNFVALDHYDFTTGIYAGHCLNHQIPVIEIGDAGRFHGSYANLTLEQWSEFVAEHFDGGQSSLIRVGGESGASV